MIVRSLLLFLIALIALVLGAMVFRRSSQSRPARLSFFLASICLAVWSIGLETFLLADDLVLLDLSSRYFYAAAAVFCPTVSIFTAYAFLNSSKFLKGLTWAASTAGLLAAMYIFIVPEFIVDTQKQLVPIAMANISINSLQYWLFAIFFCIFFLLAVALGYVAWKQSSGLRQKQIFVYTTGLILASIPGLVVDLILPAFGNYSWVWIGPVAVSIFLFAIMYSIIKYRMMDVKSALSRSVSYIFLITTLALLYFILAYVASLVIFQDVHQGVSGVNAVYSAMAIVLSFAFQPIKRFF